MGMQNAIVTRISGARVRTTHVSGMSTDIGIELGQWFDLVCNGGKPADTRPVLSKLRLHAETVFAFVVGGVLGVLTYRIIGLGVLLVGAVFLICLASWGLIRAAHGRFNTVPP